MRDQDNYVSGSDPGNVDPFDQEFPAKITVVTSVGSGIYSGLYVYDWIEQQADPGTGLFQDAINPRLGQYSVNGMAPLLENNNVKLNVNAIVIIKVRSIVDGGPVYQCEAGAPANAGGIKIVDG